MSVKVLSRVLGAFHEDSDPADRLVLVVLADEAHDDGITWIGQERIAKQTRLSERHVRRCLKELDGRGEIEIRKAQRGRRRISVYRVAGAPSEPDYDQLPFDLSEPFTAGHRVLPSESLDERDDRTSETVTTGHLAQVSEPVPSIGPVSGTRNLPATVSPDAEIVAPKLTKIDGRDYAFDTLAEVCALRQGSPRMRLVGIALSGARGKPEEGIRTQFARDCPPAEWDDPAAWERQLAIDIRARALLYRQKMPGAALTPTALAKWWTDLPGMPDPGRSDGRVTAAQAFAEAQELQRQGR